MRVRGPRVGRDRKPEEQGLAVAVQLLRRQLRCLTGADLLIKGSDLGAELRVALLRGTQAFAEREFGTLRCLAERPPLPVSPRVLHQASRLSARRHESRAAFLNERTGERFHRHQPVRSPWEEG